MPRPARPLLALLAFLLTAVASSAQLIVSVAWDPSTSQKSFRIATIVISRDRVLNDDEMAFYESMARRGEARQPLPYTSGFARGTTKPFYVATRGLATVDFRLSASAPPRRRSVKR